jgi:hypothetical protein
MELKYSEGYERAEAPMVSRVGDVDVDVDVDVTIFSH